MNVFLSFGSTLHSTATQVVNHGKIITVRPSGASKAAFAERFIADLESEKGVAH